MKRIQGITGLLIFICIGTTLCNRLFVTETNLTNIVRWTALYGILGIGAAFVIITGGIDLSIGSVVGLTGCLLAIFLQVSFVPSGHSLTVTEVDPAGRILKFDGAVTGASRQDKFEFSEAEVGRRRQVTIEQVLGGAGTGAVRVKESLGWARPGMHAQLLVQQHMSPFLALALVLLVSGAIGLVHGLLIAKLRLQPFVVTLCGLLFYRGITRLIAGDRNVGFGNYHEGLKYLVKGKPFSIPVPFINWIGQGNWGSEQVDQAGHLVHQASGSPVHLGLFGWIEVPMPFLILTGIAILSAVFLNRTIYGRYLFALGRNEQAAQYSGINTDRMVILAYVLCAGLSGLGGILFVLDLNSVQPATHGSFYELYAIAAAVLGGCSLQGGEGSVLGVVIGTAVMRVLRNSINLLRIPTHLEYAIIGMVILAGVMADEIIKRVVAKGRAVREAKEATAAASEEEMPLNNPSSE